MSIIKKFISFSDKVFSEKGPYSKKIDKIWSEYKILKNKPLNELKKIKDFDLPDAEIKSNGDFFIRMRIDSLFFCKGKKEGEEDYIMDMEFINLDDRKSIEGTYRITDSVFSKYKKMAKEISDWRDDISKKTHNKSDSFDLENIDFSDGLGKEELNIVVNEEFKKIFKQKKFQFEFKYNLWTSKNENKQIVERIDVEFSKIEIDYNGKFYANIYSTINHEKVYFYITTDTKSSYIDLEAKKPWEIKFNDIIKVDKVKKNLNRVEKRKEEEDQKYPIVLWYEAVCSSYDSTELINEIKSVLELLQNEDKN